MAKSDDRKAKAFVRDTLATTCRVTLREIEPEPDKKTADFEMIDGADRVLVAELKTIEHRPSPNDWWSYEADPKWASRLLEKIDDAYKQVSAYPHPWAVILHNADPRIDISHFDEAFRGERVLGAIEGRRIVRTNPASYGRTIERRYEIDLYIWVDELDRPCRLGVYGSTPAGHEIAEKYFRAGVPEGNFPPRWPRRTGSAMPAEPEES